MRVLICGGRNFLDRNAAFDILDRLHDENLDDDPITCVIQGDAKGADRIGEEWAKDMGIPVETYPARWEDLTQPGAKIKTRPDGSQYDAAEGSRRNTRMLDEGYPDFIVALPGGWGTFNMLCQATERDIHIFNVPYKGRPRNDQWRKWLENYRLQH